MVSLRFVFGKFFPLNVLDTNAQSHAVPKIPTRLCLVGAHRERRCVLYNLVILIANFWQNLTAYPSSERHKHGLIDLDGGANVKSLGPWDSNFAISQNSLY